MEHAAMKIYWLFATIFFIVSCSTSNDSVIDKVEEPDPETVVIPEKIEEVLVIDSTDLKDLPKDLGGLHIPYPLGTTEAKYGYYAYTPSNYSTEHEYPLLLFLHGSGEIGDSSVNPENLDKVLVHGPPVLIESRRWKPSYPFVVISPQVSSGVSYWNWDDVHKFIEYITENYSINRKRIYLTGLSLGGGGCWYYAGKYGKDSYAAAIVPICGRGEESLIENLTQMPIWAFHGSKDQIVPPFENYGSVTMVNAINQKNPAIKAKVTLYPGLGHDSWSRTYFDVFGDYSYDPFHVSIFDWMLQYKKE